MNNIAVWILGSALLFAVLFFASIKVDRYLARRAHRRWAQERRQSVACANRNFNLPPEGPYPTHLCDVSSHTHMGGMIARTAEFPSPDRADWEAATRSTVRRDGTDS